MSEPTVHYNADGSVLGISRKSCEPYTPASHDAGEAVSRLRERAQNEATSIALNQMLNDRDSTIATLTAELAGLREEYDGYREESMADSERHMAQLAEAREQRDSLRDECERLREAMTKACDLAVRWNMPSIFVVLDAALSASGREGE